MQQAAAMRVSVLLVEASGYTLSPECRGRRKYELFKCFIDNFHLSDLLVGRPEPTGPTALGKALEQLA
ncbi:hypothetical protein [Rhizobium lentis]|uniref:Uncharacterized protein n=1 Tax=Rhizobium lentis TaxID=1138194 RepID=A0A9Q3QY89_9HYPH|nr:hypothetical protein [Rhizobium lentis]MBX4958090.1 hypothetical protein [Rhizobium lentis]MBX4976261.1 hypothetical protein [Rhizobium lentis]MBX4988094.1 hypothetical protein [Rhizobium lentis]MBX5001921.1 hypothetical protein [Rhizobium lentis]MBX5006543.1 hypothetical protein [Rhizobium lentis]